MKVGFIQFDPLFGDIAGNVAKVTKHAEKVEADLLVLPELFNTGYLFTAKDEVAHCAEEVPGGPTTEALCELARNRNVHIVGGIAERDGDRFFNSAVIVSPQGYVDTYRKVHLFYEEKRWFEPGTRGFRVYDIGLCTIGVMICFDWIFPEAMRILALKGAQVICHPSNLVLPFCQEAMKTRCLENRVFSITANRTGREDRGGASLHYTGRSRIVAPNTDVLYSAGESEDEVAVVEIDPARATDKQLNEYNHLFNDRRPEFYGPLLDGGGE